MKHNQRLSWINYFLGCVVALCISLYLLICLPIFIYRFFVTNVIAPYFSRIRCHPVPMGSQGYATDFYKRNTHLSSRSSVLVNVIFEGNVSKEEFYTKLKTGWIERRNNHGKIMYPEFQCYIDSFMGFMFWKHDCNFSLESHVKFYDILRCSSDASCEEFICNLTEKLLNTSFTRFRSPWDIYLINNYRNSTLCSGPMTVLLLRFHHAMVDGPSLLTAFGTGMMDQKLETLDMVYKTHGFKKMGLGHLLLRVLPKIPCIIHDAGYLLKLLVNHHSSPLLVSDGKKSGKQLYNRTALLPVERIKQIKHKYGVKFTTVLLTAISAGLTKLGKLGHVQSESDIVFLPVIVPIPLWGNSKRLGHHVTGTVLELPITFSNKNSLERLQLCEDVLIKAQTSMLHMVFSIYMLIFFSNLAPVARYFAYNSVFPIYLTNFPTPTNDVYFLGKHEIVAYDYTGGGTLGNAGVGFIIPSYKKYLRIIATAEAVLSTDDELAEILSEICSELERLSKLSG